MCAVLKLKKYGRANRKAVSKMNQESCRVVWWLKLRPGEGRVNAHQVSSMFRIS